AEPTAKRSGSAFYRIIRSKPFQLLAAFVLILGLTSRIQFSGPAILDNDGYYHIRWSKMLRESAPHLPSFGWLPLTILDKKDYVDHHFLFHVLLMPFTFGDLRVGAKVAAALFSAIGLTGVFALLVVYGVPYRWLWLPVVVAGSEPFLYRMSMTRAPSITLLLLGAGAYFIIERKPVWLAITGFVFVWLYSLFPLLFGFAVIYSACVYLAHRRIDLVAPIASLIGIIAGLVVNPYFPKDLVLFAEHVAMKLPADYPVAVGVEWDPYDTWVILTGSAVTLIVFFIALLAFNYRNRAQDIKPLFFLIVSTMLLLISFKSRRFIEYFAPFAGVYAAFTLAPALKGILKAHFKRWRDRLIASSAAAVIAAALFLGLTYNVIVAGHDVAAEPSPYSFKGASEYLIQHTAPDEIVFNCDWDAFPALFYYNTHNKYIAGLDPSYLYERNHDIWQVYDDITNGNSDSPGRQVQEKFGAEYVVASLDDTDFLNSVSDSGDLETVYQDSYAVVLKVKPANQKDSDTSGNGDSSEDDGDK
ncbi:MAG: hypothetical protein ACREDR_26850, partial [Blastocatellia bacterium]